MWLTGHCGELVTSVAKRVSRKNGVQGQLSKHLKRKPRLASNKPDG